MSKTVRRVISLFLTMTMVFSGIPTFAADNENASATITGFDALAPSVKKQSYWFGDKSKPKTQEDLSLPETLGASISLSGADEATATDLSISIPVTWNADREYSGELGEYKFTPEWNLEEYPLADGVSAPLISVEVTRFQAGDGGARVAITGADYAIKYDEDSYGFIKDGGANSGDPFIEGGAAFSWDDAEGELVLDNFVFQSDAVTAILEVPADTTIVFKGTNSITGKATSTGALSECPALYSAGDIYFMDGDSNGGSSIVLTGSVPYTSQDTNKMAMGIKAGGEIWVHSGDITATIPETVTGKAIIAGSILISGGKLTANAATTSGAAIGIDVSGSYEQTGGAVEVSAVNTGSGSSTATGILAMGDFAVSGGTLDASVGDTANFGSNVAISLSNPAGTADLSVTGDGVVTATAGANTDIMGTSAALLATAEITATAVGTADGTDSNPEPLSRNASNYYVLDSNSIVARYAELTAASQAYTISSVAEFNQFRSDVAGGNTFENETVTLLNDIDLTSDADVKKSVGSVLKPFKGTFDGDGYTITRTGISIGTEGANQGLFGYINGATIKNLKVAGDVTYTSRNAYKIGSIVGTAVSSTIENCGSSVALSAYFDVGGIVGAMDGLNNVIKNCYNTGAITAKNNQNGNGNTRVGGILGIGNDESASLHSASIENCYNTGEISATGPMAGGITSVAVASIKNCYNTGKVTSTKQNVGGIAGELSSYGSRTFTNCYNTGNIKGSKYVGGIFGFRNNANVVTNCLSLGLATDMTEVTDGAGRIGGSLGTGAGDLVKGGYARVDQKVTGKAPKNSLTGKTTKHGETIHLNEATTVASIFSAANFSGDVWDISPTDAFLGTVELPTLKDNIPTSKPTLPQKTTAFSGGNGTSATPYLISSADDMAALQRETRDFDCYKGMYFKLTQDVDLNELTPGTWKGIGMYSNSASSTEDDRYAFQGYFDGQGNQVTIGVDTNWVLSNSESIGIFSFIKNAEISNLKAAGSIESAVTNIYVGGITAHAENSKISDCSSSISMDTIYVGGIVCLVRNKDDGTEATIIERCYNTGDIKTNSGAGGIVAGASYGLTIKDCYNTGSMTNSNYAADGRMGGIAGFATSSATAPVLIENCYNTGNVLDTKEAVVSSYAGGILGNSDGDDVTVKNSVALGLLASAPPVTHNHRQFTNRILGGPTTGTNPQFIDNRARSDMKVGDKGAEQAVTDGTATNINGEDIIAGTTTIADAFAGFDTTTVWVFPANPVLELNGNLPTLQTASQSPAPTLPEAAAVVAPTVTTSALPAGVTGEAYSATLTATGTVTSWRIGTGTLPAGLTLNSATGVISGTPTAGGASTFTVIATNSGGDSSPVSCTITIGSKPVILTSSIPELVSGEPYSFTFSATSDTPIAWTLESGTLPLGLTLDPATGTISGQITTLGGQSTLTIKATNTYGSATRELTFVMNAAAVAPEVSTTPPDNALVGEAYSYVLSATGTATMTWTLEGGSLPAGLTLSSDGTISGTPATAGASTFTVKVTNSAGSSERELTILVVPVVIVPTITTTILPEAVAAFGAPAYSQTLTASGTTPISWSIVTGNLPSGLSLDPYTGVISGQPMGGQDGDFTFTVMASNAAGSATVELTLTVSSTVAPPEIVTNILPDGAAGIPYSEALSATGAAAVWSIDSGSLPAGLTLNADGTISGTPTVAGTSTFTVKATNSADSDTVLLSITIAEAATAPSITTTTLLDGSVSDSYSETLIASGTGPITWVLESGALPDGLALSSNGVISGTPTMAGTSTFTVKAMNNVNSATQTISLTIQAAAVAPVVTTTTLSNATVGVAYSQWLTATGTARIKWALVSGSTLPAGLTLSEDGLISGTPTQDGVVSFTVEASNSADDAQMSLTLTVDPAPTVTAPSITTTVMPEGTIGTAYGYTLTALGTAPITWTVESGSLPAGLSLSTAGVISGTPAAVGTATFTVKATNSAASATKTITITINDAAGGTAPSITIGALPSGKVGKAYSKALTATGTAPITWSVSSGSLPDGLTLNSATGVISGTPTSTGTSNFTVRATNGVDSATKTLSITIDPADTSGGGGGGGGSLGTVPKTEEKEPDSNIDVSVPTTKEDDKVTAVIDEAEAKTLSEDAKASNNVTIRPEGADSASEVVAVIPKNTVSDIAKNTNASITLDAGNGFSVKVQNKELGKIAGDMTIAAVKGESNQYRADIRSDGKSVSVDALVAINTAGNVAYTIDENGNKEVIKLSATEGGRVFAKITTPATIIIENHSGLFSDMQNHPMQGDSDFVANRELFVGVGDDMFDPNGNMTAAMMATVLYRLAGLPEGSNPQGLSDIPAGAWYEGGCNWSASNGFIDTANGMFDPNRTITRLDLAVTLYRYAASIGMDTASRQELPFTDTADLEGEARAAMEWAYATGILQGYGNNTLGAGNDCTRIQVAAMFERFVQNAVK